MNHYKHPKSSLFLIETMLNIFFFIILSTVCIQLFFKAHTLSEDASATQHAVRACASIAEVYQSNANGKEAVLTIYPDAIALNTNILVYFDENYLPCSETESSYRTVLELHETSDADITFFSQDSGEIVYSLTVSSYMPRTLNALKREVTP